MTSFDDDRLIDVETRLAYQEDTLQQLNDVICKQQDQIDALTLRCQWLVDKLRNVSDQLDEGKNPTEEKPPHY